MFRVRKVPGCLHGVKFSYEILQWSPEIVLKLVDLLGGELQEIQESGFFRIDIKDVGCLTGIYGQNQANLIINPGPPRTILKRKNSFEKTLLNVLQNLKNSSAF